jgi:hypothetical protein
VIILKINVHDVVILERKGNPPIACYANRETSALIARKRVKEKTGYVHVVRNHRNIKPLKDTPYTVVIYRAQPRCVTTFGKSLQSLILERQDHMCMPTPYNVKHSLTDAKEKFTLCHLCVKGNGMKPVTKIRKYGRTLSL